VRRSQQDKADKTPSLWYPCTSLVCSPCTCCRRCSRRHRCSEKGKSCPAQRFYLRDTGCCTRSTRWRFHTCLPHTPRTPRPRPGCTYPAGRRCKPRCPLRTCTVPPHTLHRARHQCQCSLPDRCRRAASRRPSATECVAGSRGTFLSLWPTRRLGTCPPRTAGTRPRRARCPCVKSASAARAARPSRAPWPLALCHCRPARTRQPGGRTRLTH
jgi:hypothetical protein